MRRIAEKSTKRQSGELMLEAALIFPLILLLCVAILSMSFMFYQQALITNIASEVAADIGKNFKFIELEMGADVITPQDFNEVTMFRSTFNRGEIAEKHKIRAEEYAKKRLALSGLGLDPEEVSVSCEVKHNGFGRAYVVVNVSQKTDFFLSVFLDYMGITEEKTLFSATAEAECVDLMSYTASANLVQYGARQLEPTFGVIGDLYGNLKKLLETFGL